MPYSVTQLINLMNNMNFVANEHKLGHQLFNRISLEARPLMPGTDPTKITAMPCDLLIDSVPYWFPGCDDAMEIADAGVLTTAAQYRKVLLSLPATAAVDKHPDGVLGGDYTIAATAAVTWLGAGRIRYRLNGQEYEVVLDTTITMGDDGDITQAKYRAFRVEIDELGVVTALGSGNHNEDSTEEALARLASKALTANTVTIAYLTISKSDGVFNIATTNTNAANTTAGVTYARGPQKLFNHLIGTPATDIVATDGAATYAFPAMEAKILGKRVATIALDATADMDDADTITTLKWGGWVICISDDGTTQVALAADGAAGAVSAMAYASQATLDTALDLVVDRLPHHMIPVAFIRVYNGSGGTFTAGTTNWNATSMTTTVEMIRPPSYYLTATLGIVSTVSQAAAEVPICPDDEVPIGYIELPVSFTAQTTNITAAMCKPIRLQDYRRLFQGVG